MADHRACCYCGRPVDEFGPRVFSLDLNETRGGPRVVLRWHRAPCADLDPLHLEIAEATNLPDGREGDDALARAYLKLLDRLAAPGDERALRAAVDVRRDVADLGVTMRGSGLAWGRRSPRVAP